MPADVEAMMYVGEVPWHGLGTQLTNEVNAENAIKLAGLDWDVETARIETADQKRTAVEDYRVTRRVQDNAILGVVRRGFKPIQNRDAFGLFDGVVGQGQAVYHTAGSLQGGSKVWILAKLPGGPLEVGKTVGDVDEVDRYLLLSNAHDGSRPLQMLFTPVRVVCSNTLGIALTSQNEDDKKLRLAPRVAIRQNAKAAGKIKEAQRVMKKALKYYEKFGEFSNFLYAKQVSGAQVQNAAAEVFPANKQMIVTPTVAAHRESIVRLFEEGKGHERIFGTAWALFNAFTEYADHGYTVRKPKTTADERAHSIWMGGAKGLKERAAKVVTKMVW